MLSHNNPMLSEIAASDTCEYLSQALSVNAAPFAEPLAILADEEYAQSDFFRRQAHGDGAGTFLRSWMEPRLALLLEESGVSLPQEYCNSLNSIACVRLPEVLGDGFSIEDIGSRLEAVALSGRLFFTVRRPSNLSGKKWSVLINWSSGRSESTDTMAFGAALCRAEAARRLFVGVMS